MSENTTPTAPGTAAESANTYTVVVRGCDAATATYLLECYPGTTAEEEGASP